MYNPSLPRLTLLLEAMLVEFPEDLREMLDVGMVDLRSRLRVKVFSLVGSSIKVLDLIDDPLDEFVPTENSLDTVVDCSVFGDPGHRWLGKAGGLEGGKGQAGHYQRGGGEVELRRMKEKGDGWSCAGTETPDARGRSEFELR
jgi:hypothetical protein